MGQKLRDVYPAP